MTGAILIARKELLELLKDRRTLALTFLVPLLVYPAIFWILGFAGAREDARVRAAKSRVGVVSADVATIEPVVSRLSSLDLVIVPLARSASEALLAHEIDVFVQADTQAARAARRVVLRVSVDDANPASRTAAQRLADAAKAHERALAVDARSDCPTPLSQHAVFDVETVRLRSAQVSQFILMMPYFIVFLMYAGSMHHGIYATAGERERGMLTALLVTRLSRGEIVIGKLFFIFASGLATTMLNITSIAMTSLLLSHSHFVPNGTLDDASMAALDDVMAIGRVLAVLALAVPLGLLFSNVIMLGGMTSKNAREASLVLGPGLLLVLLLGVFSMSSEIEQHAVVRFIPVLNVCLSLRRLFQPGAHAADMTIAIASTTALAVGLTFLSVRILGRESVVRGG